VGRTLTSAISGRRSIGTSERTIVALGGLGVWLVAALAFLFPRVLAWPLGVIGAWVGATLLWKGLTKPVSLLPPGPVKVRDGQAPSEPASLPASPAAAHGETKVSGDGVPVEKR